MPKARVEGLVTTTVPDAGASSFDVLIGWNKEKEYAQLAVVESPRNQAGIRIGTSDEVYHGLYHTLSPETIDEIIKTLRKVKRQVWPKRDADGNILVN